MTGYTLDVIPAKAGIQNNLDITREYSASCALFKIPLCQVCAKISIKGESKEKRPSPSGLFAVAITAKDGEGLREGETQNFHFIGYRPKFTSLSLISTSSQFLPSFQRGRESSRVAFLYLSAI